MILPFSTQLNGKPTYFVEKIWEGLKPNYEQKIPFPNRRTKNYILPDEYFDCIDKSLIRLGVKGITPKLHTIRTDKNNRWRADMPIHFYINNRRPDMFQFAPVVRCVSVQDIEIRYKDSSGFTWTNPEVIIDGITFDPSEWEEIAKNDGFDNVADFFAYFNTDFTGKIIHWTDLKY